MHVLESIPIFNDHDLVHGRFPVQYVIRPLSDRYHDFRGYAGRVAGGILRKGDKVKVLPSGLYTTISSIDTIDGAVAEAFPPMSVTITLADDIDISRGDMIVAADDGPRESTDIDVMLCWMNQNPLQLNGKYALKHTTKDVRCIVRNVKYILNISTLDKLPDRKQVGLNEIARISLRTTRPVFTDTYAMNRITGSLILIDEATNETVGAGMIL